MEDNRATRKAAVARDSPIFMFGSKGSAAHQKVCRQQQKRTFAHLTFTLWCQSISFTPNVELKHDLRASSIRWRARSSPWIMFL